MTEYFLSILSVLWLGILTSISPCPLATNIAAISYISYNPRKTRNLLISGLLYSLGRAFVYVIVSWLIINGITMSANVSFFLQDYISKALGPALIIVGMFLVGLLELNFLRLSFNEKTGKKYADKGLLGTFILGFLFALSFCPVSAALFFGGMIPIAVKFDSYFILPLFYGLGTAVPVVLFAFLLGAGMMAMNNMLIKISKIEKTMKYVTGCVFIIIGIYLSLIHIFNMDL